jgi:hypothetical protein
MMHLTRWAIPALLLGSAFAGPFAGTAARADAPRCDRSCLRGFADKLIGSIVAHDPSLLPLSDVYAATENSVPSALGMMVIWRTATAAKSSYYVVDPESAQIFMIVTLSEGPSDTLLFGRLRIRHNLISEVELYTNRSRGQGGFQFDPDGPSHFPQAWTVPLATQRRATRAELLQAGRSIFDTSVKAPEASSTCVVMENGKVVAENPDVLKAIGSPPSGVPEEKAERTDPGVNPDGTVSVPCGNPPGRPTDKHARTTIIDEEQGVVVSLAVVHGIAEPYLITTPTVSAFVPNSMLQPYADMLKTQQDSGRFKAPAIRQMPATAAVAEVHRVYDGKLQGLHLLVNLGAPGSESPWVVGNGQAARP